MVSETSEIKLYMIMCKAISDSATQIKKFCKFLIRLLIKMQLFNNIFTKTNIELHVKGHLAQIIISHSLSPIENKIIVT